MPTRHHPGEDVNLVHVRSLTRGQRIADSVAKTMGSWPFIIGQSLVLLAWIAANELAGRSLVWDVYPFILLNLMLSFQAAYSAPFIMMSQNRQALKDRVMSENDYAINKSAAAAINEALDHLEAQDLLMMKQHEEMLERLQEILERPDLRARSIAHLNKHPERSFQGGRMKLMASTRRDGRG